MRALLVRATLASALSLSLAASSEAQRRELSILGGGTYTGASGPLLAGTTGHAGFVTGLTLRLPRSHRIAMEADFLILHRRVTGERGPSTTVPALVGPEADFARVTFVEIPLLLRFQEPAASYRPVRPFLVVGPSVAIRLACGREVRVSASSVRAAECAEAPEDTEPLAPSIYQDMDVALHAGVGVELRRFAVFVRASRSLRNFVEDGALPSSPFDGAKLWGLSAGVDYVVRVF